MLPVGRWTPPSEYQDKSRMIMLHETEATCTKYHFEIKDTSVTFHSSFVSNFSTAESCAITSHPSRHDCCCHQHWHQCWHCRQKLTSKLSVWISSDQTSKFFGIFVFGDLFLDLGGGIFCWNFWRFLKDFSAIQLD